MIHYLPTQIEYMRIQEFSSIIVEKIMTREEFRKLYARHPKKLKVKHL